MPLESEDNEHLVRAQGYCELGMYLDAAAELEEIDAEVRHVPEVLGVRVEIYRNLQKWELMQGVAKKLVDWLAEPHWWICWAYATRKAESIASARMILLDALEIHPEAAIVLYNLACYECQLGAMERAKEYLKQAFRLDKTYRETALDDEDLKSLW